MGFGIVRSASTQTACLPTPKLLQRAVCQDRVASFQSQFGLSNPAARVLASRIAPEVAFSMQPSFRDISSPFDLLNMDKGADRVLEAISTGETIGLFHDYDVDGATSGAVLESALIKFGVKKERIVRVVGDRNYDGYGLTDLMARKIGGLSCRPSLVITADCGSADDARISLLAGSNIDTVVTDHHTVQADHMPASAIAFINPNQPDCPFQDKAIAGVMVAWLLMVAVRQRLIKNGLSVESLAPLLSYVACGTVADCVSMSSTNNRAVVYFGLQYMSRFAQPCWKAFAERLKLSGRGFNEEDIAFGIAPRINSASRCADAETMAAMLVEENYEKALQLSSYFEQTNAQRKNIEKKLKEHALIKAAEKVARGDNGLVIFNPEGHPGVHGIVAAKITQAYGRPCIMLAPKRTDPSILVGSARTIDSVRLDWVFKDIKAQYPTLLLTGGGHRGAFGCSINLEDLTLFEEAFIEAVSSQAPSQLNPVLLTDGYLPPEFLSFPFLDELKRIGPFGRKFEAPIFCIYATIKDIQSIGDGSHLKLTLQGELGHTVSATWFFARGTLAQQLVDVGNFVIAVLRVGESFWNNKRRLQLSIVTLETPFDE